ncbi:MAG TPA: hypothetical protein V6D22_04210 [Candidatus Obscuribacterales bacterium]
MSFNKAITFGVAAAIAGSMLTACGSSNWRAKYEAAAAKASHNPPQLHEAELGIKEAMTDAYKAGTPEPKYADTIAMLGEVLSKEGKFEEAQQYLLAACSLATATKMSAGENVRVLKLLETAYEQTKNYEQASQTEDALVNYVATELSPLSPEYKQAIGKQKDLKALVAVQCAAKNEACCELEKAEKAAKAKQLANSQPTVLPGND